MDLQKLAAAVRDLKDKVDAIMVSMEDDHSFNGSEAEDDLRDAKDLLGVLAHIVDGKPVDNAFGSPGDWGYSTAIGKALASRG